MANSAPRLTAQSLAPGTTGNQNTQFTFQITYTDANNDAPQGISVVISGTSQAMSKVTPADNTYTDGCQYRYIGYLQPGSHTYYFTCSDGLATNTTATYGPITVTLVNLNAPRLTSVTFTPATGDETTSFTFRVQYTDADNNEPATITTTIDGTAHTMAKENSGDTNVMDGCWYTCTTTLGVGSHTFSMQCSDGTNSNSTATVAGPTVTLSAAGQAAQAGITAAIVIGCIAGGILGFAALVIYREKLPQKMRRVIPPKEAFSRAGSKVKDGLGTAGEKTKRGLKDAGWKIKEGSKTTGGKVKDGFGRAGYKIRTFFSDLAFKIRHH